MQFNISPRVLAILAVAGLTGCSTAISPQEEAATAQPAAGTVEGSVVVPNELVTVRPGFIGAWSGTNSEAFHLYFTDNAVVTTPSGTFTGWPDIHTRWITPTMKGMSNYAVTPTSITWTDNDITEMGTYSYRVTHDGGHVENKTATYTQRLQVQPDGTWKIASIEIK